MKAPNRKRAPGRPKGSTSDATRARVLAAARICFARSGYAGTTNRDIADEAGITAGAIYQYFDSKTALFLATVDDATAQLVPLYRSAGAEAGSMRDAFRALLSASVDAHEADASLSAFLSALPVEMRRHDELRRAMSRAPSGIVELIVEVIRAGVNAGEIAADDGARIVKMFVACTMGMSLYAASIDPEQLGEIVSAFGALLDGTLFRGRPRRR
jgi:AcrR family transcriptional regulator